MSNYINQNLINIPASGVPSGTLAFKVGDHIFTAGSLSGVELSESELQAYVVVDVSGTIMAQKLAFTGTQPSDQGQPSQIENLGTFNTGHPEPTGSISTNSMNFYKCATVDTTNQTWTGYALVPTNDQIVFSLSITSGLTFSTSRTPEVGKYYNENALVEINPSLPLSPSMWTLAFDSFASGSSWSSKVNSYTMTSESTLTTTSGILTLTGTESVAGPEYPVGNNYMFTIVLRFHFNGGTQGYLAGCADGGIGPYTNYWIYSKSSINRPRILNSCANDTWHHIDVICTNGSYSYRYNEAPAQAGEDEYWSSTVSTGFKVKCIESYREVEIAFLGFINHTPTAAEIAAADAYISNIKLPQFE